MLSDESSPPMGTGKGIQQLAFILLFAAILAGCASSNKTGGPAGIDQMIPGATKSKTMYYALYKFGRHWKFPIKRGKPVKFEGGLVARGEEIPRAIPVNPTEINQARDWISNTDPSLEQIEQRAQTEAW